ncbi:hypothetical protein LBMAG53_31270 [Planctomycetota bacterium]|nr:hypothetical protein LBMAG53_31270 [Planctomycetota bacterium]
MQRFLLRSPLVMLGLAGALHLIGCAAGDGRPAPTTPTAQADRQGSTASGGKQTGQWTYTYPDGAKKASGSFANDVQEGPWTWWWPDGVTVKHQGAYHSGQRTGSWRHFHANGKPASSGSYRLDRQDGTWTYFTTDGRPFATGGFDLGVKQGPWQWWHPTGQPRESGTYFRGLKVGTWTRWNPDGTEAGSQDLGLPLGVTRTEVFGPAAAAESQAAAPKQAQAAPNQAQAAPNQAPAEAKPDSQAQANTAPVASPATAAVEAAPVAGAVPEASKPAAAKPGAASSAPTEATPEAASQAAESKPAKSKDDLPAIKKMMAPGPAVEAPQAASEAQIETPTTAVAGTPELTPTAVLPGIFTAAQVAKADGFLRKYTSGGPGPAGYDNGSTEDDSKQKKDLLGKPLPQTRFLSSTGAVIDLAQFAGKPLVVVIMRGFSGQVCLYCAAQTAALSNGIDRFRDLGSDVVVIYPGPIESVPAFIEAVQSLRKDPPPMPLGLDVSLALVRKLGIEANLARPTSLVIDKGGIVRYAYVGTTIADRPSVNDLIDQVRRWKR